MSNPTWPYVVQVFADQLDAWMEEFHGLLTFQTAALPESDPEKETLPDAVRLFWQLGVAISTAAWCHCRCESLSVVLCVPGCCAVCKWSRQ